MMPTVPSDGNREKFYLALEKLGGRLVGTQYNQKSRLFKHEHLRQSVDGGYCGGCCMDWIRRVVLADGVNAKQKWSYKEDDDPDAVKQIGRAVSAHLALNLGHRSANAQFQTDWKALQSTHNDKVLKELEQETVTLANEKKEALQWLRTESKKDGADIAALQEKSRAMLEEIRLKLESAPSRANARMEYDGFYREFWSTFDELVGKQGILSRKLKKTYSNLSVVAVGGDKLYVDGVSGYLRVMLPLIAVGAAGYVGLNRPPNVVGHAVAIYRPTEGTYLLFDPNYGVFGFNRSDIAKATLSLFTILYPKLCNDQFEDEQGHVQGEYCIFKKG